MSRLVIGPFNRVEGDLEVRIEVVDGRVSDAHVNATMFRLRADPARSRSARCARLRAAHLRHLLGVAGRGGRARWPTWPA
jgi:hypothetical protein